MELIDTLTSEINNHLGNEWKPKDDNSIQVTDSSISANEVIKLKATFLLADLADSTVLAEKCSWEIAANIIRAYLHISDHLIREHGGIVRSFGGGKVMGIFTGETPNTSAVNCARKIDWMVEKVLTPKVSMAFPSIPNNKIKIAHCIGIDAGEAVAMHSGIQDNSDLIWIGKAPAFAAELASVRKYPYSVYVSKECFMRLGDSAKESGEENIWSQKTLKFGEETHTVYRTSGMLRP